MSSLEVVRAHRKMEFIFAEIVRFLAAVDPSELEFMLRLAAIGKIGERKARPLELAGRLEAERLFIEFQAALEVEHIEVVVGKLEFHGRVPFCQYPRFSRIRISSHRSTCMGFSQMMLSVQQMRSGLLQS